MMASSSSPEPVILMYIDDSNIFGGAGYHFGRLKEYPANVPDKQRRLHYRNMIATAGKGRKLQVCNLYTSEEGEVDVEDTVTVKRFKRCTWTNKEKQVDTSLTADAVEDLIQKKTSTSGPNGTLILFSGDRDLTPVVDKALTHGYNVELYTYDCIFSGEMRARAGKAARDKSENIELFTMEQIEDITYLEYEYAKKDTLPLKDKIMVASIPINPRKRAPRSKSEKQEILTKFVDTFSDICKLPFAGTWDSEKVGYGIPPNHQYESLFLILTANPKEQVLCTKCKNAEERPTIFLEHITTHKLELEKKLLQYNVEIRTWDEYQVWLRSLHLDGNDDTFRPEDKNEKEINYSHEGDAALGEKYSGDDARDFEVVKGRKGSKRQKPKIMDAPCAFKFWCLNLNCNLKHSKEELQYFKSLKDVRYRGVYKTEECKRFNNGHCPKQNLCHFGHGSTDLLCFTCKNEKDFHLVKDCPRKTQLHR